MTATFQRRRLAFRLRRMRERAGLTLEEAARHLDKTRSSLGRIETGQSRADVHLARSMMDFYDIYDPDLLDLIRKANRPGWWAKYGIDGSGFFSMETEACAMREFNLVTIPGLLQTEGYMRALFAVRLKPAQVAAAVSARRHRQRRLIDEEFPLELAVVIDESALRKKVGGAEVTREQLRHLAAAASDVSVQVLPNDAGAHPAVNGAFAILDFLEDDVPSVLHYEHPTSALRVDKPEEVAEAELVFDRLRAQALSPADSAAFIVQLADELRG